MHDSERRAGKSRVSTWQWHSVRAVDPDISPARSGARLQADPLAHSERDRGQTRVEKCRLVMHLDRQCGRMCRLRVAPVFACFTQ